jgi:hypothetical protein
MKAVYGLYPDGAAAQQAVNQLRSAGLADREITVLSSQPMEDYAFGQAESKTYMWWIACAGALAGMAAALGLAYVTEMSWKINVGGLPYWAWWPNLIITFELTMLGAIVATVTTLIVTAFLGQGKLYDPEVSDGKILVGVENPTHEVDRLEAALSVPPGAVIRRI